MKKIAFVTPNYTGATLPIAKELLASGYQVDYYFPFGVEPKDGKHPKEAMLLKDFHAKMGLHEISSSYFQELYEYMGKKGFRMFYFRTSRPFKNVSILRNIMYLWRGFQFSSVIKHFKKQNYEMVNLIGNFDYDDFLFFHKNLPNTKIVTSFHEVCNHWNPDFKTLSPLLKYIFDKKKEIVVHSKNSLKDILRYKDADKNHIHHINFGIFETFKTMKGYIDFQLPEKYILFFGAIKPYKGLSYLLEAIKKDSSCLGDCKLVIAGKGHDDALSEFKQMENVIIINRYIKNEELIYLIEHCQFVVCPYTTMSQSGLPQTIFAFNKPIIASDLDGFKEIVVNEKVGLLFKSKNVEELNIAIKRLTSDKGLYRSMLDSFNEIESINKTFSWSYITKQYLKLM